MTEVALQGISKSYDGRIEAVSDLHLTIPSGQITALLGPSGCGKTTVLKMIAGLLPTTTGDVLFNGRAVTAIPAEKRDAVMVFQNHLLFPYMSVLENVGFGLRMRGVKKQVIEQRVAEMLALVQLPSYEKRTPRQLSGGQQQRIALARALIVEPEVLLLDEPLSNLDAHLRDEMRELIVSIQRELGITTIFVTHDQEEAVILAQHIALMFAGRLQQFGPPADFYERPSAAQVARFFGGVNFVEGVKRDTVVTTPLGVFCVPHSPLPNGPVLLTIRPENVVLGCHEAENTIPARLESRLYAGTHTRLKVLAETAVPGTPPLSIEVVASAAAMRQYENQQILTLHFPPDHTWLVPAA